MPAPVVKWTKLKGIPVDSNFKIFDIEKCFIRDQVFLKMTFPQYWTVPFCPGKPHLVNQHTQLIPLHLVFALQFSGMGP